MTVTNKIPENRDIGIISFVPDNWGPYWQPRHQVLTRLSRFFNVVWMEPAIGWREMWSGRSLPRKPGWTTIDDYPGFSVFMHGRKSPQFYRPIWLNRQTERSRIKAARNRLIELGCKFIVGYIWRPEFSSVVEHELFDYVCYHIDDEYTFADVEKPLDPDEENLIACADSVIIHSPGLYEKKGHINKNTIVVPNGVDYAAFSGATESPNEFSELKRPIIGYAGVVQWTIDWSLVYEVAMRRPEWTFVIVGPEGHLRSEDSAMIRKIECLSNSKFLGGKPAAALPSYVQQFDVCMMPYKVNDYTKFIYPLKLHEYMATGRPAVATPIRSLLSFAESIIIAKTGEEWSNALEESLSGQYTSPESTAARQAVAREFDWGVHVQRIASQIQALAETK